MGFEGGQDLGGEESFLGGGNSVSKGLQTGNFGVGMGFFGVGILGFCLDVFLDVLVKVGFRVRFQERSEVERVVLVGFCFGQFVEILDVRGF